MEGNEHIRYSLDIRDLGERGLEVVVSVVNEGEEILEIHHGVVEVVRDGVDLGRHPISFKGERAGGSVRLGQFEIAEGHFHLTGMGDQAHLHFRVHLDCRQGAAQETARISRRIDTVAIRRARPTQH